MGFCPECNLPAKYVEEDILMRFRLYCTGCGWWKIEHEDQQQR